MIDDSLTKLRETIIYCRARPIGLMWWNNLPQQLETIAKKHDLTLLSPFKGLSYNYIQPVLGPNQETWVLKCSVLTDEVTTEVNALRHYNGIGAVRFIDADLDAGMERCVPGRCLVDLPDEAEAIVIAMSVSDYGVL